MLSVREAGIKYISLSFWYESTRDWTPVSLAIGENSTYKVNDGEKLKNKAFQIDGFPL